MEKTLTDLYRTLLDTDEGINEQCFNKLGEVAKYFSFEDLQRVLQSCDGIDGRFYLPKE